MLPSHSSNKISLSSYCKIYRSVPLPTAVFLSSCPTGSPLVFLSHRKSSCLPVLPEVLLTSCPTGILLVFLSYRKSSCLPVLPEIFLSSCPTGKLLVFLSYQKSSGLPVLPEIFLSSCPTGSLLVFLSHRKSSCLPVLPEALLSSLTVRYYALIPTAIILFIACPPHSECRPILCLCQWWKFLLLVYTPVGIDFRYLYTVYCI
jgi:hypothetical protein